MFPEKLACMQLTILGSISRSLVPRFSLCAFSRTVLLVLTVQRLQLSVRLVHELLFACTALTT